MALVVFYIITKKQKNIVSIKKEEMTGIMLPYPILV